MATSACCSVFVALCVAWRSVPCAQRTTDHDTSILKPLQSIFYFQGSDTNMSEASIHQPAANKGNGTATRRIV